MKLFHSLLYPLLGGLFCLSCSDDEQDTGTKQPTTAGEVTFGVDLTGFSTRVTQDGSSWNDGDKIGTYVLDQSQKQRMYLMSARKRVRRFLSLPLHR